MNQAFPRPLVMALALCALTGARPLVAQSTSITYPRALRSAARTTERIEKFMAGEGDFDWQKLPKELASATGQVETYLSTNPDDVPAMLLRVRIGHVESMLRPTVLGRDPQGGLLMDQADHYAPLHALLDRALALQPELAEAHYWRARLHAVSRPQAGEDGPVIRADWDRAIESAERAVELAPADVRYREFLAVGLAQRGDTDRAREVLREVEGGNHLLFLILQDFEHLPIPPDAVPFPRLAATMAEMFAGAPGAVRRFSLLRVRAFAFPGNVEDVEAFYRARWPEFELFEEGGSDVYGQFFVPNRDGLAPARSPDVLRQEREPDKGIMFAVTRLADLTEEQRSRIPPELATATEVCELMFVNYRNR